MKNSTSTLASLVAAPALFAGASLSQYAAVPVPAPIQGTLNIIETAEQAGDFDTLLAAVDAAGLTATLESPGPFTVFAPTDAAFAAIPPDRLARLLTPGFQDELTDILTFHVLAGEFDAAAVTTTEFYETVSGQRAYISTSMGPMIENANIVVTDIQCSNGIIHVIDTVIFPELRNLLSVAGSFGRFNTLAAAVEIAGLTDTLKNGGPFTVFAPTDDAFDALPPGALDNLINDPAALADVLLYHVTPGRVFADQVLANTMLPMANGDMTDISVMGGNAFIDDARILLTDIQARNGVIHVINGVLLP